MVLIKRYSNRKLYDTQSRRYITLAEIGELIRQGQDIQVIDHSSGTDLTEIILLQIIFEQEKKLGSKLPQALLSRLIRTGGNTLNALRSSLHAFLDPNGYMETEIKRRLLFLEQRGQLAMTERQRLEGLLLSPDLAAPLEETHRPTSQPEAEQVASLEDLDLIYAKVEALEKELAAFQQAQKETKTTD